MDLERTKHIAKRIVRVFETGRADGRYDACAILADGAGISYGIEQGTDKAGTLDAILLRYCDMGGESKPFVIEALRRLAANETARVDPKHPPEWCRALMALLRDLGKRDPIMARAQEEVFDELYWLPVQSQCIRMRLEQPLSWAIVYDTAIHSGVGGIAANRNRFPNLRRPVAATSAHGLRNTSRRGETGCRSTRTRLCNAPATAHRRLRR